MGGLRQATVGGLEAVLAYLSRYTHRVAISNSRLVAHDERGVTSRWKDFRARDGAKGREWFKTMTLGADEFDRRFLIRVMPSGFHRIRHYACSPVAPGPDISPESAICWATCRLPTLIRKPMPRNHRGRSNHAHLLAGT